MSGGGTHQALKMIGIWLLLIYVCNFLALSLVPQDKNKPLHTIMVILVVGLCIFALISPSTMKATSYATTITAGGGFGILMLLNVWGIIWRNQKKIIQAHIDQANGQPAPPDLATLTKVAFIASRTNFYLSIPMLFFMAAPSHLTLP